MALQISFYDIQRKFRRKSVVLFALISGYYILSFLLIGTVLKIISHKNFVGLNTRGARNQANAENFLSVTLKSLFAVVENYPNLKANRNFRELYEEITTTENRIAYARQFYNDSVLNLNNKIEMFPSNIAAGMFNFKQEEMFEISGNEERKTPEIKI